jgi:hypothetical protein
MRTIDDQGYGYPLKTDNVITKLQKYWYLFLAKI